MGLAGTSAVPVQLKLMLGSLPDREHLGIAEYPHVCGQRGYPRTRDRHSSQTTVLATMRLRRPQTDRQRCRDQEDERLMSRVRRGHDWDVLAGREKSSLVRPCVDR